MTPGEIARAILELYGDDPKRWTQRVYALDANGFSCSPEDKRAACFCIRGAALAVASSWLERAHFHDAIFAAVGDATDEWNDQPTTTFADVKRVLTQIAGQP